jgi:hypothetical protein
MAEKKSASCSPVAVYGSVPTNSVVRDSPGAAATSSALTAASGMAGWVGLVGWCGPLFARERQGALMRTGHGAEEGPGGREAA